MNTSALPTARRTTRRHSPPLPRSTRVVLAVGAVVALGAVGALASAVLHTAVPIPPPAPVALTQSGAADPLGPDSPVNRREVTLSFRATAGSSAAAPEVEIVPAGHPFTGRVSARGRPIPARTRAVVTRIVVAGLRNGMAYHWRVRLHGADHRFSRWVAFGAGRPHGAISFRVDLTPPPAPALSSPSDPGHTAWYATPLATALWPALHDASGIAGYAYSLDRNPHGAPPARMMLAQPRLRVRVPGDGPWYLHVRAMDGAGNWGSVSSYLLHVDLHPATFTNVAFARLAFDPDLEREPVAITLANPGHVRAQIFEEDDGAVVRTLDLGRITRQTTLLWDGRDDAGRPVPEGDYRVLLTATDALGQQSVADYSGIAVVRRRLVVSLSAQRMVAYDGATAVRTTLVTTGNKALPTPVGTFHIIEKLHPFTFISPWPPGSPYYFPPSPVQYALLFEWNGYFIHDAPWRSAFGPGSNAASGAPGQNTTGTHGCVNVPPDVAAWLYDWAPVGTVVQVVP